MRIQINVTKEVLERSKMCNTGMPGSLAHNCAVAIAVRDLFPNAAMDYNRLYFTSSQSDACSADVSSEVNIFIHQFDNSTPEQRVKMQPFSFEVDVPEEVIDQIGIDTVHRILSESKTLELVNN